MPEKGEFKVTELEENRIMEKIQELDVKVATMGERMGHLSQSITQALGEMKTMTSRSEVHELTTRVKHVEEQLVDLGRIVEKGKGILIAINVAWIVVLGMYSLLKKGG